jgi:outer membrane protein
MSMWMQLAKSIAVLVLVAVVIAPGQAKAQATKVGFVNVGRLLSESPQAKIAMEALQEEFAPRQREIVAQQNEFQGSQEQVQRDLEVMGPEERRNAERDLRKAEREIARGQEEITEDFNLRRNEELGKLQRDLMREVQSFAEKSGYDLIVSEGVLYASQAVDITQQILVGLETSFQKPPAL